MQSGRYQLEDAGTGGSRHDGRLIFERGLGLGKGADGCGLQDVAETGEEGAARVRGLRMCVTRSVPLGGGGGGGEGWACVAVRLERRWPKLVWGPFAQPNFATEPVRPSPPEADAGAQCERECVRGCKKDCVVSYVDARSWQRPPEQACSSPQCACMELSWLSMPSAHQ